MQELEIDPEDVEVLYEKDGYQYQRREFWTDGEWVRLGRDVTNSKDEGGRFIEIKAEKLSDFYNTLRSQSGVDKHTLTDSRGSDEKYIVDAGYSLNVYNKKRHVLYYNDHEYGIFRTAIRRVNETRETFDYDELVESYVESLIHSFWEILNIEERSASHVIVEVYGEGSHVNLNFVDKLRDDEHVKTETPEHDSVGVYAKDGGHKYQFKVDATTLPGAPEEGE